jgi:hypothetical protein
MGSDVWGGDGNLNCTHDICDCCGAESGTDDFDLSAVRRYRKKWSDAGHQWFIPELRPANWDIEQQAQQVPDRWR